MFRVILSMSMIVLFLIGGAGVSEGTNWLYLIENGKGDKCYIDIDSISRTAPDRMQVVRKIEFRTSQEISSRESHLELDCAGSRIRSIKERVNFNNGDVKTIQGKKEFTPVGADDIEELLVEFVCSLKRAQQ